jgi:hypothetical protein
MSNVPLSISLLDGFFLGIRLSTRSSMQKMIHHSDFYGKKIVSVLLQPLVNCRQQGNALIEKLLVRRSSTIQKTSIPNG